MPEPEVDSSPTPVVPAAVRAAVGIVRIQAAALVVAALVLVVLTFVHTTTRLWAALVIAGFALLAAVILELCARGLTQLRPSSRSPVLLLELLCVPVAYSLGIQAGRLAIGLPVLVLAVAVIVLLLTPAARRSLDRVL